MKNLDGTDNLDGSMSFPFTEIPDGARIVVTRQSDLRGARGTVLSHEARQLAYPPGESAWFYYVQMDKPIALDDGRVETDPIEWEDYEIAPLGIVEWLAELASQGHEGAEDSDPLGPTTRPTA